MRVFVGLAVLAVVVIGADEKYLDTIATRSSKVEGYLKCGKAPLANAHVRLFRSDTEG